MKMRNFLKSVYLLLNSLLKVFGFRLSRTTRATRTFTEFFDHVKGLGYAPNLVIDVGVCDGTPDLYKAFPTAKFILVEPLVEVEPALRRLTEEYDAEYHLCAATESIGEMEISVFHDLGGSSLLASAGVSSNQRGVRKIPTAPLDTLLPEKINGSALLKIDVQGAEMGVLKGTEIHIRDIDMVITEAGVLSGSEGATEFSDLVSYMKERDFVLYDLIDGYYRPLDGALHQIDLVFVPSDSPLRRERRFASDEQRRKSVARAQKKFAHLTKD